MPGPRAEQNLQMLHPRDWQGGQMPRSSPGGWLGAGGIDWCINSETVGHKDLRFGQIVFILVFYNISFSWPLPLDGFQFIFPPYLLRDSENEELGSYLWIVNLLAWDQAPQ